MSKQQALVETLLKKAIDNWTNGSEPPLFPVRPEDRETPAGMIWNVGLNALAYGLEHGMELGYKMKEAELA